MVRRLLSQVMYLASHFLYIVWIELFYGSLGRRIFSDCTVFISCKTNDVWESDSTCIIVYNNGETSLKSSQVLYSIMSSLLWLELKLKICVYITRIVEKPTEEFRWKFLAVRNLSNSCPERMITYEASIKSQIRSVRREGRLLIKNRSNF